MNESKPDAELVAALVQGLSSNDPVTRESSREKLVATGGQEVTRALLAKLIDPRTHVRWEAAKALTAIADPVAAAGLMHALDDEDPDVRWVAGEGLIALKKIGLMTVLSGLMKRARSIDFCKGAHHVLHDLKDWDFADTVAPVLEALEASEPAVSAPPAAFAALNAMKS